MHIDGLPAPVLMEVMGFKMTNKARDREQVHSLLRPRDFKLLRDANAYIRTSQDMSTMTALWVEDGEITDTVWQGIDYEDVSVQETQQCLWNLIDLAEETLPTPRHRLQPYSEDWNERLRHFVAKWGLLDFGDEAGEATDTEAWRGLDQWAEAAQEFRDLLYLIIVTEDEQQLPDAGLELLAQWVGPDEPATRPTELADILSRTHAEYWEQKHERDLAWIREQTRQGKGLELQRLTVTSMLHEVGTAPEYRHDDYPPDLPIIYVWDESGRRIQSYARGVREIALSHLQAAFTSPEIDLLICSICGKPFQLERDGRRPRSGAQRFCTEECRVEAKRQSNLASWHRNKQRWKKRGGGA